MLILECSQGCYRVKIRSCDLDLWLWKSVGFQTLLRTKYVPSLVKIHWRMLILVFTRMLHCQNLTQWHWPLTLKINRVPDSPKDYKCKYVPSLVKIHWRMLILECSQGCYAVNIWSSDLDLWPWKSIGFQILLTTKYVPSLLKIHWMDVDSRVFTRMLRKDGSVTISLRNFVGEGIINMDRRIMLIVNWLLAKVESVL